MLLYRLRVSGGARANETALLVPGKALSVGRGKDATLRFPDDPWMSRVHTEFQFEYGGWVLANKSQHGTLLAGIPVRESKRLAPGDSITIGGTNLVFESFDGQPPPEHAAAFAAPLPPTLSASAVGVEVSKAVAAAAPTPAVAAPAPVAAPVATFKGGTSRGRLILEEEDEDTGLIPIFLPPDSRELTAEELVGYDLFAVDEKDEKKREEAIKKARDKIEKQILWKEKLGDQPTIWLRTYKPNEVICKEGDYGSTAFFITKGDVQVGISDPRSKELEAKTGFGGFLRRFKGSTTRRAVDPSILTDDGDKQNRRFIPIDGPVKLPYDRPLATLKPGDIFGEMTCMSFYPRSATCVAGPEGVECLEMLRSVLDFLRKQGRDEYKKRIEKNYRERSLSAALRSIPIFQELTDAFIDGLKPKVELVDVNPDTRIFAEGDEGEAFYLIRLGFVKVSQKRPGGEVVLQYLGPGQFFGEVGLLEENTKRAATCTALDHVELIKVKKTDFKDLLKQFPEVAGKLKKGADDMLAELKKLDERPGELPLALLLEKGLMNAQNLLLIDLDKCTRCDECVRACADSHDGITRLIRDGLRVDNFLVATACRACTDPVCMIGCPVGSIRRVNSLEILIEDWCIGCGKCSAQCPYGNIQMHPYTKAPGFGDYMGRLEEAFVPGKVKDWKATIQLEIDKAGTWTVAVGNDKVKVDEKPSKATPTCVLQTDRKTATEFLLRRGRPEKLFAGAHHAVSNMDDLVKFQQAFDLDRDGLSTRPQVVNEDKGRAATCDLCQGGMEPRCVYACPHGAAQRVEPRKFFSARLPVLAT